MQLISLFFFEKFYSLKGNIVKNNKNSIDENIITNPKKIKSYIEELRKKMRKCASDLEFEEASKLRDQILILEEALIELT